MKNLRKGLFALAIVAGVTGAIAEQVSGMTKGKLVDYTWTHYDTDGTTIIGSPQVKSLENARIDYGCDQGETRCAEGTATGQDPVTLFYPD